MSTYAHYLLASAGDFNEQASWRAGVVRYDVEFAVRTVVYFGSNGEEYVESYPAIEISPEFSLHRH